MPMGKINLNSALRKGVNSISKENRSRPAREGLHISRADDGDSQDHKITCYRLAATQNLAISQEPKCQGPRTPISHVLVSQTRGYK